MGKFAIIIGTIVVVFLVFVFFYVRSFYAGQNPDDLTPGILRGNISIAGVSEYSISNGSLGVSNTDGWKYASPILIDSSGDHYTYNMSIFPGHFLISLYNTSYTTQDLPKRVTIESGKTTVVDITLMPNISK